ncbi:MAG: glycosyltransferase family 9 protein [Candidatus Omnitrophica bacterium]|nr:glycosyltransferase family 9 protein [Candidatus Omnitrophota bacterium]
MVDTYIFIIWLLLAFVISPFVLLKRKKSEGKKVVLFMQSKIGDLVAQLPLCRELKRYAPTSFITVILTNPQLRELVKYDPHIDEIIIWEAEIPRLKKIRILFEMINKNYDWSFNLSSQSWIDFFVFLAFISNRVTLPNVSVHPILKLFYKVSNTKLVKYEKGSYSTGVYLSMLKFIGIEHPDIRRQLFVSSDNQKFIEELIDKCGLKNKKYLIGINVSCANKFKQWPEQKFAQLIDMLLDTNKIEVIITGSQQDRDVSQRVISYMEQKDIFDFSGMLTLGQFAALCKKLDLFISVDSGPLYIANAMGTAVIDIAGPVETKEQLAPSPKVKVVRPLDLPCAPCSFVMFTARECRLGTKRCLEKITALDIFNEVKKTISDL